MNSKQRRRSTRYWQHTVPVGYFWSSDFESPIEWCRKNIGKHGYDWTVSYAAGVFQFNQAKHANWFVLKWGRSEDN